MTTVINRVKTAAYTSVGINLLLTDAVVGREVAAPKQFAERASTARTQATDALTDLRSRTEPATTKIAERLPEQLADAMQTGRNAVWSFIGIDAPKPTPAPAAKTPTKSTAKSTAKSTTKKTVAKKAG